MAQNVRALILLAATLLMLVALSPAGADIILPPPGNGTAYGSGGNPFHGQKQGQGVGGGYYINPGQGQGQGPVNNPHGGIAPSDTAENTCTDDGQDPLGCSEEEP